MKKIRKMPSLFEMLDYSILADWSLYKLEKVYGIVMSIMLNAVIYGYLILGYHHYQLIFTGYMLVMTVTLIMGKLAIKCVDYTIKETTKEMGIDV